MLLYTVRCSPSILAAADDFFFDKKVLCVRRGDRYPNANPAYSVWWKTCLRNMANAFYRLFAVSSFLVVWPLFRYCSRIVYSGLYKLGEPGLSIHLDFHPTKSMDQKAWSQTEAAQCKRGSDRNGGLTSLWPWKCWNFWSQLWCKFKSMTSIFNYFNNSRKNVYFQVRKIILI